MSQDLLYSSDASRLLQELETASTTSTKLPAMKNPEHVEALHDLYGKVVGLGNDAERPVKPRSPRMTNNELKAMKVASIKVENPRFPLPILRAIVRFCHKLKDVFAEGKSKGTLTCQQK